VDFMDNARALAQQWSPAVQHNWWCAGEPDDVPAAFERLGLPNGTSRSYDRGTIILSKLVWDTLFIDLRVSTVY
jgi:hypothetical protein